MKKKIFQAITSLKIEKKIILALNGEFSTLPYEELRKTLMKTKMTSLFQF